MNLLQEYLLEQLLNEGIEEAYEFYRDKLKREKFDELIALDPTFEQDQDRLGTYGKWILTSYLRKSVTEEDLPNVTEMLFDFDSSKRFIKDPRGSDINRYKTLVDIRAGLDTVELTDNQRERQRRKEKHQTELGNDAELLFDTDKWELWAPKTYGASMKLGSGSSWCTASTGNRGQNWFKSYTKEWGQRGNRGNRGECGDLYIFINTKNRNVKFQAHVVSNSEGVVQRVSEFHDINNRTIMSLGEFLAKEGLVELALKTKLKDLPEIQSAIEMGKIVSSKTITITSNDSKESHIKVNGHRIDKDFINGSPEIKTMIINFSDDKPFVFGGGLEHIETVVFSPKSKIKGIDDEAFRGFVSLKSITLPTKLTQIGESAFRGCTNLGEVFLPDSLRFIGYNAFEGCNNVVLKKNKGAGKIEVPEANISFLKQHLQIIDNTATSKSPVEQPTVGVEQAVIEESFSLQEAYSPSMPPWLKKWLDSTDDDVDNQHYENRPEKFKQRITSKRTDEKMPQGTLNLSSAIFVSIPVPQSNRDPVLKDPYLPIFHIKKNDQDFVYIPGVNDDSEISEGESRWQRTKMYKLSMIKILAMTVDFCYVDTSNTKNFTRLIRTEREVAKKGYEIRVPYNKLKDMRDYESKYYDKSGNKLNPSDLLNRLRKQKIKNVDIQIKNIYDRISFIRSYLHKVLVKLDIDNPKYQEKEIKETYDRLFDVIHNYRQFVSQIEEAMKLKNQLHRDLSLYRIFNLDLSDMLTADQIREIPSDIRYPSVNTSYNEMLERLERLESKFKKVKLVTLEDLRSK